MTDLITRHANDRTNHRSFLKFCEIPWKCSNSEAKGKFCGSAQNSAARRKRWALTIISYFYTSLTPFSKRCSCMSDTSQQKGKHDTDRKWW